MVDYKQSCILTNKIISRTGENKVLSRKEEGGIYCLLEKLGEVEAKSKNLSPELSWLTDLVFLE